jgi:hypothetical protein
MLSCGSNTETPGYPCNLQRTFHPATFRPTNGLSDSLKTMFWDRANHVSLCGNTPVMQVETNVKKIGPKVKKFKSFIFMS